MIHAQYQAFLKRHLREQGLKGSAARNKKYTKEERGAQIKRGLKKKKQVLKSVDNFTT